MSKKQLFVILSTFFALFPATNVCSQEASGNPREWAILGAELLPVMTLQETQNCMALMDYAVKSAKHYQLPEAEINGSRFLVEIFFEAMNLKAGKYGDYKTLVNTSLVTKKVNGMVRNGSSEITAFLDEESEICLDKIATAMTKAKADQ